MYHYVHPIKDSAYPKLKGLEFAGFKKQLDFLSSKYEFVTADDVINAVNFKKKLPDNSCWLTFDDGYKGHHSYVLPELLKRKIQGSFFPSVKPVLERIMLDTNSIHYILASAKIINDLVLDLNIQLRNFGFTNQNLDELWNTYAVPSRYDSKEVIYIKRLLQHALPKTIRNKVTTVLFEKYVGLNQTDFAEELYMSVAEVKELVNLGMYVGSHGYQHLWLNKESGIVQKSEIDLSIKFLSFVGSTTENWIMCYPFGAYNDKTIDILSNAKCAVAVTTEVGKAYLGTHHPLKLPRFDTNDFPQ
jgi:peptidoglycan/xylan/chitin deacetylase (PgdA/CDA1 family)